MTVVLKKKTEKNKIYALAVLAVVAAYLLWSNTGSDSSPAPTTAETARVAPPVAPDQSQTATPVQRRGLASRGSAEFRPRLGSKRPEERVDPNKVDPTLRLDLLAKVQNVPLEGGSRNLFQFGVAAPAAPLTPLPKVPNVRINGPAPAPVAATPPGLSPEPQAPPIPLKYYGFANAKNEARKKAFFLDGEDIIVAWEGDTVKSRYKIVHIGVNSVEMEDTQLKSRQTLPLEAELAG